MHTEKISPHFIQNDFIASQIREMKTRIQRSLTVGSVTFKAYHAALFYDRQEDKFTLSVNPNGVDEETIYDCVVREQWGRKVMIFGIKTFNDGYVARGHGTLNKKSLSIKLMSGHTFYMDVDSCAPYMAQFAFTPPKDESGYLTKGGNMPISKRPFEPSSPPRRDQFRIPVANKGPRQQPNHVQHERFMESFGDEDDFSEEDLRRLRGELPIRERKVF